MAYSAKPVTLTQIDAINYESNNDPQPLVVVGPIPGSATVGTVTAALEALDGFDEEETQTLKNVEGVLTWVTDTP